MGISLTGLTPATTYDALIKVGDNGPIGATLKTLSDGLGNDLPMQASTTGINFTGTVSGVASGVSGAIQFSNGSAFASDASNFFWDNTNKRLGVGTNSPSATAHFKGSGITASTFGLIIQNSAGTTSFSIKDNGVTNASYIEGGTCWFNNINSNGIVKFGSSMSVGFNTDPSATAHIKGSGSTSATTSLLVQNSSAVNSLMLKDNGDLTTYGLINIRSQAGDNGGNIYTAATENLILSSTAYGTGSAVNINTNGVIIQRLGTNANAHISSVLDIRSTTQGFLPPRMTTTQKNAISSPAAGLQVFDTTMNATCEYTGTAWRVVSAGAQALAAPTNATTVDLSAGNVLSISLTSSTTFTFTGASVGTYILKLIQGGSGSYTVTWPGTVIWSGGTAPTLTTTVSKLDIITLVYDGTNYYGNYSLNY